MKSAIIKFDYENGTSCRCSASDEGTGNTTCQGNVTMKALLHRFASPKYGGAHVNAITDILASSNRCMTTLEPGQDRAKKEMLCIDSSSTEDVVELTEEACWGSVMDTGGKVKCVPNLEKMCQRSALIVSL